MVRIALVLIFTFLCFNISFGQQNEGVSAQISVTAEVVQSIELITVNTISFGDVQPGQQEIYVNPVNDINSGYMIAVGTPQTEFRLTYQTERELTQIGGDGTLSFVYQISGNSVENQSTSELLENDNRSIRFNQEGRYYLWLGGRVNIENTPPGDYEGDFTIEIDYI